MIVEQSPPSLMLRGDENIADKYISPILKLHQKLHGSAAPRKRLAERRDKGVPRGPAQAGTGPVTEAEFGRKRQAAIAEVLSASPSKRARRIADAPLGLAQVAKEAAEETARNPPVASEKVAKKAQDKAGKQEDRDLHGAKAAADARAKRAKLVIRSQNHHGRSTTVLKPGCLLLRRDDELELQRARRLKFTPFHDPVEFVTRVARRPHGSCGIGHVVVAPPTPTDFGVCGQFAAALMGCFYTTARNFRKHHPRGTEYTKKYYKSSRQTLRMAVSEELQKECPTLPPLLKVIAEASGSRLQFYAAAQKLHRECKAQLKDARNKKDDDVGELRAKAKSRREVLRDNVVLCTSTDAKTQKKEYQPLYSTPDAFILKLESASNTNCPGIPLEEDL